MLLTKTIQKRTLHTISPANKHNSLVNQFPFIFKTVLTEQNLLLSVNTGTQLQMLVVEELNNVCGHLPLCLYIVPSL